MNQPALTVRDLTVAYGDRLILRDLDVDIPEGQLVALVGPNGSGKSTLLKAILGLITPVSGTIHVGESGRDPVGFVPQRAVVDWDFPIDVMGVVLMGTYRNLGWWRKPGAAERSRAREALAQVGLSELATTPIGNLSGGQQQRVFVARALAQQTQVTLLDEPFAGVDEASEATILEVLRGLVQQGHTMVVVHHDLDTVRQHFDYVIALQQGQVVATGTPESVLANRAAHPSRP
jgi:manganese/zinc/iron transport system ATP- binding protein